MILFSALFLFVDSYEESLDSQLVLTKQLAEIKNLKELEVKVKDLNNFLTLFSAGEKMANPISDDILEILGVLPSSVKIDSFLFDAGRCKDCVSKISLKGYAASRSGLINFTKDLKFGGYFNKVTSPVSNLLAEKDIDFSLVLELKQ
jgi:hypothetical protein